MRQITVSLSDVFPDQDHAPRAGEVSLTIWFQDQDAAAVYAKLSALFIDIANEVPLRPGELRALQRRAAQNKRGAEKGLDREGKP